jgi:hypothetical protein
MGVFTDDRFYIGHPGEVEKLTILTGGNVGIGTTVPQTPAPNAQAGNLDANDIYLRSTSKWLSQSSGAVITKVGCTLLSGTSGWKNCGCPAGYKVTGQSGYNCRSDGGSWNCGQTTAFDTYVAFYHDGAATAYVGVYCAK